MISQTSEAKSIRRLLHSKSIRLEENDVAIEHRRVPTNDTIGRSEQKQNEAQHPHDGLHHAGVPR
jgi:hypothetical protein